MSRHVGKSIVDHTPTLFNDRWHAHQHWRCSKDVVFPPGSNVIVISNWRHKGDKTPVPLFDIRVNVAFGIRRVNVHAGYFDENGNWHWDNPSLELVLDGNDVLFKANVGHAIVPHGFRFRADQEVKLYLGNIRHFSAPFFFHGFAVGDDWAIKYPTEFTW